MVARRAHNPEAGGSSPPPATNEEKPHGFSSFFLLSGTWSKGIRCKSGTVPAAVNLEYAPTSSHCSLCCEKASESGGESEDLPCSSQTKELGGKFL